MFEQAVSVIEEAKSLAVLNVGLRQRAADLWDAIRAFRKQAEAQKEEVCRPFKNDWEDTKAPYDAFVKECQGHELTLQKAMGEWDKKQAAIARAEQDRLQAIADKANAKIIEKAEAKGIEPILKVAPVVVAPPKSIETQSGTTQSRSTRKVYNIKGVVGQVECRADNPSVAQLLKDYPALFILDRMKFNALAKTGLLDNHPNVEMTEEYVYSQR